MSATADSPLTRPEPSEREVWDRHWRKLAGHSRLFGRLASVVRRTVLMRAVRIYTDHYFTTSGVLVETGCGTGQASAEVRRNGRRLLGLDLSLSALVDGRGEPPYHVRLGGDLRRLPFRDGALAGIWNLGVMEHFAPEDGLAVLREMRRALAPGGVLILFWPPTFGLSRFVLAPIEWLRTTITGRPFRFFPDEVNRLTSRPHARETLAAAGLEPLAIDFSARDAFVHLVVVARRPT